VFGWWQISAVDGVLQMILALHQGTAGDVETLCELAMRTAPEALGDVSRT